MSTESIKLPWRTNLEANPCNPDPPSTLIVSPVMYAAPGDSRKHTAADI